MGEFLTAGTLIVKKERILEGIPGILQKKHFAVWGLDEYVAKQVSENRHQMSAGKDITRNTVFEVDVYASEVLIKYVVIGGHNDLIGKTIVISKTKLKTYTCQYKGNNWEPGRCIGKRYAI